MKFEYWDHAAADVLRRLEPRKIENPVGGIKRSWDYAWGIHNREGMSAESRNGEILASLNGAASIAAGMLAEPYGNVRLAKQAVHDTLIDRQAKYGKNNVEKLGLLGILVRMSDKIERLINLESGNGSDAKDESKIDTIVDIVGYYVCAVMNERGDFGLPFSPSIQSKTTTVLVNACRPCAYETNRRWRERKKGVCV